MKNRKSSFSLHLPFSLKFILRFLVLFFLLGLIYFFLLFKSFDIENILIQGDEKYKTEVINLTKNILAQRSLLIFKNSNVFLYPKNKIKSNILNIFSEIEKVEINLVGLQSIQISLKKRTPIYFVGNNKFIDKNQVVYEDNDIEYMKFIKLENIEFFSLYKNNWLDNLKYFSDRLEAKKIKIKKIILDKTGFDIFIQTDIGLIKINNDKPINNSWLIFSSAIEEEGLKNILQNKKDEIEYIDIRFDNRIYYKLKNETNNTSTERFLERNHR